jgi:hypothetical protein
METRETSLCITGGCQCGTVRYQLTAPLQYMHFCHCRMCQRAVGGPFAALGAVPRGAHRWTRGVPALFASSSVARRGFCKDCGTPLSFEYLDSTHINLTLCSLDDPSAFPPERHFGIESQQPWLHLADDWPREGTLVNTPRLQGMVSHQVQE